MSRIVPLVLAVLCTVAVAQNDPSTPAGLTAARFHAPDEQLRSLIESLLATNPDAAGAWARTRAAHQRAPQGKAMPDPRLTYRYFPRPTQTRVGPLEHTFEVSQELPWTGKKGADADRVKSLASGLAWQAEDVERARVADLKHAYFRAAYLQEARAVNAEERDLLERFEQIALRRYANGEGIQQSVVKVQTDLSRLESHDLLLQQQLATVTRRIATLIGRPSADLALAPIRLDLPATTTDVPSLEAAAVRAHPRVRAVEQRIEADAELERRRSLESRPDFRVGVGYSIVADRRDPAGIALPPDGNGQDVVGLSVGVNIPIHRKKIRSGVAEARESRSAHEATLRSVQDGLRYAVREAVLRIDSLGERGRLFRDVILPQAETSLASAEAAYATDRVGFLDVLDAQRVLFQSRLAYRELVSDLWIALADLEFAAAGPAPVTAEGGPS